MSPVGVLHIVGLVLEAEPILNSGVNDSDTEQCCSCNNTWLGPKPGGSTLMDAVCLCKGFPLSPFYCLVHEQAMCLWGSSRQLQRLQMLYPRMGHSPR